MEYYIYNIPLFVMGSPPEVSLPDFCTEAEETIPHRLLNNVDVVYVGDLRDVSPIAFGYTEYNANFDKFLSDTVGYPTLLTLTMGLFASPYAATSIQEYFANGFEKYFLDDPWRLSTVSPILHDKIEQVINV